MLFYYYLKEFHIFIVNMCLFQILRERKIMKKNAKDNNGSVGKYYHLNIFYKCVLLLCNFAFFSRLAGHNHKPCLLDHMLDIADKTGALSEDDIVTQVCTFMLAVSNEPHHILSFKGF